MGAIKIMKASAGSGKTYKLAYNYVRDVINNPLLYSHILAVTFTNKATEEMKSRIIGEINDLANGGKKDGSPANYLSELKAELSLNEDIIKARAIDVRTRILHDYSRFTILTIDKFFQRIIRAFIKEIGLDTNFNLELQTESILTGATDLLFDSIDDDKTLRKWILNYIEERMDDNKRWDTRAEMKSLGTQIFAEAYSDIDIADFNKEMIWETVKHAKSLADQVVKHMQEVALSAIKIIDDQLLTIDDFPYKSTSYASYFYKVAQGVIEEPGKRVLGAAELIDNCYSKSSPKIVYLRQIAPKLNELLNTLIDIYNADIKTIRTANILSANFRRYAILPDIYNNVRKFCDQQNIMPISETNKIINRLIDGNQAPFIFEKMGNSYSHYMIDEFQDTSLKQWHNFYPLISNALSQSDLDNVLLVGDVKQSIYRWRGGDWKILAQGVNEQFPEAKNESLDKNYRSLSNIVNFNNNLIGSMKNIINENLNCQIENVFLNKDVIAKLHDLTTIAYADHNQEVPSNSPENQGYITILQYDKQSETNTDYGYVISRINDLQQRGYKAADIAILVRNNKEAYEVASALLTYKNSVENDSSFCYDVVSQEALVISVSPVIRFIIACFKVATNGDDTISRAVYKQFLNRKIENSDIDDPEREFISALNSISVLEAFETVVSHFHLDKYTSDIPYIQAFHELLINFSATKIADLSLFLQWWQETGIKKSITLPNRLNAITIITIHKSKGLQYQAVIIPQCNWSIRPKTASVIWCRSDEPPYNKLGRIPLNYTQELGESHFAADYYNELVYTQIDNLNILYVALTRAQRELHIMMPENPKVSDKTIDGIILSSVVNNDEKSVRLGVISGSIDCDKHGIIYSFGVAENYISKQTTDDKSTIYINNYTSFPLENKIRIRPDSQRYFGDDDEKGLSALSPRYYGNLMHTIFERIKNIDDADKQIDNLIQQGEISSHDAQNISSLVAKAFQNQVVSSWFSDNWDTIRSESRIIIPGVNELKRPDRVMIKDNDAIVVDYKFGGAKLNKYNTQVSQYMSLMREMGYKNVKGYVWYIALNELDEVNETESLDL